MGSVKVMNVVQPMERAEAHALAVNSDWRARLAKIDALDLAELENVFYEAARLGGAFDSVCKYYGIQRQGTDMTAMSLTRLQVLKRAFEAGQADLQLSIRHITVQEAFKEKPNPILVIWAGKQHAGYSDDGQIDMGTTETGETTIGGLFTSVKAQRSADGTTIGPTVQQSIDAEVRDASITTPESE